MVPPVGIEPTLLSEPDFESGASTSSTTGAWADYGRYLDRAPGKNQARPDRIQGFPEKTQEISAI
jgi:hypothetical protein